MPTGYVRAAIESIPGNEANTPTLSTKKLFPPLRSFAPHLGATPMERDDELRNQDEPLAVLSDIFDPSWEYESRLYPDLLGFYLALTLGQPTTTVGDGIITDPDMDAIPASCYRHVWTAPFGPAGASPLTAQFDVAYRDQGTFFKAKGAACSELTIQNPESGGSTLGASGPANYLDRQSDPALSPTYETLAVRPFSRSDLTLPTWLTGTGTHENFDVTIENPVENTRSMGIKSRYPDLMEKSNDGPIVVRGSIPQRQLDPDNWDALKNATGFAATARWVSDSIIAGSYPYKLFVAMANCQYVDGDSEELGNKRRHGASFDWKSTTASAGSTTITLVNATASYA